MRTLFLALTLLALAAPAFAQNRDMAGGYDHPLVPRLPGYFIAIAETKVRDRHDFPLPGDRIERVEGHVTVISYWLLEGAPRSSAAQILQRHQQVIAANGGRLVHQTADRAVLRLTTRDSDFWFDVVVTGEGGIYDLAIVERGAARP